MARPVHDTLSTESSSSSSSSSSSDSDSDGVLAVTRRTSSGEAQESELSDAAEKPASVPPTSKRMAFDVCGNECDIALSSIAHDISTCHFSGTDATTVAQLRRHIVTYGYDRTDRIRVVFKDETYFVLDGHHRVAALRELMASSTTINLATASDGSYLVPVVVYEKERAAEVAAALQRKRYGF